MIVRVVDMNCKAGKEDTLQQIGRERLRKINKAAGCIDVYFLEPHQETGNSHFGVVSIWGNKEALDKMKQSEVYQNLIEDLMPLLDSITDKMYETKSD